MRVRRHDGVITPGRLPRTYLTKCIRSPSVQRFCDDDIGARLTALARAKLGDVTWHCVLFAGHILGRRSARWAALAGLFGAPFDEQERVIKTARNVNNAHCVKCCRGRQVRGFNRLRFRAKFAAMVLEIFETVLRPSFPSAAQPNVYTFEALPTVGVCGSRVQTQRRLKSSCQPQCA